jgi:two-component system response regulator AtoC
VTDLIVKLRKVLEARGLRDRLALAASSSDAQRPLVAPKSPASQDVHDKLTRVSQSPLTPVLRDHRAPRALAGEAAQAP